MSEQIRQIAVRIKDLREISGISAEVVAKELNVELDTYLGYESGNTDIPVGFLYELANRFNVELTAILTGDAPKLHTYSIVRKGKGVNVDRRQQYHYQNLAFNFVNKKAEPFLVTAEPVEDDKPIDYNAHPGQEFNYVLEGTLKVYINGYEVVLNEGDSLYFDSGIKHGMKAVGGKASKFLAIIF